ncbi:hypothetical protein [Agromyces mangrovi Wang et al. 2018]|uniref:hypothetical protein n=1 Tax=Agromyces mangrovi TaxID=1858653 RepID=UPI0025739ECB|nr:hypothetical protein [Agromyces mangrovi]BDZ65531.1 hypothetical protein GCM10025877_24690 [Agromyces mangrovi]
MDTTTYITGRELRPGDIVVNPYGDAFPITKVRAIGAGRRVTYERKGGKAASFTVPADGLTRVFLPRRSALAGADA